MKKRVLLLSLAVILLCGLVGGATYALFSDQATNSNNTFAAGTVKVNADRNLGDPVPGPMFYTTRDEGNFNDPTWLVDHATGLWYPGKSETRQLIIKNDGTLHFRIRGLSAALTGISDPAIATQFAGEMNVKIYVSNDANSVLYNGSLATLLTGEQTVLHPPGPFIGVGANEHLSFQVTMTDTGYPQNNLQGITPLVAFNVFVEQPH